MPRLKRTKVAPSAPTAIPFLERAKAKAQSGRQDARMSGALGAVAGSAAISKTAQFDDLYDVSDKENEPPARSASKPKSLKSKPNNKRGSRQSKIPSSAQPDTTLSVNVLEDDLDDFQPLDESTPLRRKRSERGPLRASSSQAKQKEPTEPGSSASAGSRKRKFTPENIVVRQSQALGSDDAEDLGSPSLARFDTESAGDEPTLPPPKRLARGATIEVWDEVMALPESNSSSQELGAPAPAQDTLPAQPKQRRSARTKTPLSTASLQNLLPRRQHRNVSGEQNADDAALDLDSSPDDADELSFAPGRQRNGKKPGPKPTKTKKRVASGRNGKPSATAAAPIESTRPAAPRRTYARRSLANDDVNDSLVAAEDDDTFEPGEDSQESTKSLGLPEEAKAEMRKVSAKFQEVDQWAMDFEEVSGRSSSPGFSR